MPILKCVCGREFDHRKDLRTHIALETDSWPSDRCTPKHHDPLDPTDRAHLRWRAVREAAR